jgi:hypothetical protein
MVAGEKRGAPIVRIRIRPVLFALVIIAVLSGCRMSQVNLGDHFPFISVPSIRVTDRHVQLEGETDLPDGARIDLEAVWVDTETAEITRRQSVDAIVGRGSYSGSFDLDGWPAGEIGLWVTFTPDSTQSQTVIDRYGITGSKMHGARVRFNDLGGQVWTNGYGVTLP